MAQTIRQIWSKESQQLVIIGAGEQAEIAYEYFTRDSQHNVVGFCVEENYRKKTRLYDLPVVNFEQVQKEFPPTDYVAFVAVSHTHVNQLRERLYDRIRSLGYSFISYVSSNSLIDPSVNVGENVFIFEGVIIQRGCQVENSATVWPGTTIAHRSTLSEFVTVAPQVSVAGFSDVGRLSFLGTNSTVSDNIDIGSDVLLGAGSVAVSDLSSDRVFVGNPAKPIGETSEHRPE